VIVFQVMTLPVSIFIFLLSAAVAHAGPGKDLRDAATDNELRDVIELIEEGVDPDAQSRKGNTALIKAGKRGHIEIVQYLLFKGADPKIENDNGRNAIDVAERNEEIHIADIMQAAIEPKEVFLFINKPMSEAEFDDLMTAILLGRRWQIETKEKYRLTAAYKRGRRVFRVETVYKGNRILVRFIRGYGSTRINYLNNLRSDLSKRL
jgi:hypothetical protein